MEYTGFRRDYKENGNHYGNYALDIQESGEEQDEIGRVIFSFKKLISRVKYLTDEVYGKEIENKSIELELLHSQIKPHFLYNTLSSIASLARKYHDEQLLDMITSLSDLYRVSLNRGKNNITVEQEAQITQSYIHIMENRFEDLMVIEVNLSKDTLNGIIPKVLLQPFIENAINHAMRNESILKIKIDSTRSGDNIIFTIADDGVGMDDEKLAAVFSANGTIDTGGGYGISNVNRRIKLLYGQDYGVSINSSPLKGTCVTIKVPYCENLDSYLHR